MRQNRIRCHATPEVCYDLAPVGTAANIMGNTNTPEDDWTNGAEDTDSRSQYNPFDVQEIRISLPRLP